MAPQEEPREEAERQLLFRRRNISAFFADSFAEAEFVPVIDDGRRLGVLDFYEKRLTTRPLYFVQLTPSIEVVRHRDAARDKQVFEILTHITLRSPLAQEPRYDPGF